MSILIKIINKLDQQEIINKPSPYCLLDESLSFIKSKLFSFTEGIQYYPNFLKFEYFDKTNEQYIPIINNNPILLNIKNISYNEEVTLYCTNIIDIIEKDYNSIDLYNLIDTDQFQLVFSKFKKEFIDLTKEDLELAIKLIIVQTDPNIYNLQSQIEFYVQDILSKKKYEIKKTKPIYDNLEKFYSLCETTKFEDSLEYDKIIQNPKIKFNQISLNIIGKNFESGIKGRFIKINRVFNIFELSKKMPFIAFNTSTETDPMLKVYNTLLEQVTEKEMKSWILNERKKQSLITYKKIKGIVIKYNFKDNFFITINLSDNGLINAKISLQDLDFNEHVDTFDELIMIIKNAVDEMINYINSLDGIFTQSKRINSVNDSTTTIESINALLQTKSFIDKEEFSTILYNPVIANNIFEIKDTLSLDVLSIYYKKFKNDLEEESDKKGLTINIKDNPYKLDSSLIQIYGASNVEQINSIAKQIIIINNLSGFDDKTKKQKLKQKSHIKELRKEGVQMLSTKCQKPRQPIILKTDEQEPPKIIENTYTLEYKDKKYICPSKNYPYPGFTNDNIVCCFQKDQRRRDPFIRNIKSRDFEIIVQPSNFKIKVNDNGKEYETYAIKVISDYINGFNESNAMSRFFYLSNENKLVNITNDKMINDLKNNEENGIWLDNVPLARIINEPPKNKCNFPPKINEKNTDSINAPCQHHTKNNIFGYNLNSYPCCFDKEREEFTHRKRKVSDITKQHILISDKVLDYQRIGILPPSLNILFNELILPPQNHTFYRMGVVQNNSAFLNAILLALDNKIKNNIINNSNEFKKYISNFLEKNPEEFNKLNNGNLSFKFNTIENYINYILDSNKIIYWNDVIDIIQIITDTNILMLDIPYKITESTKISDYENMSLICTDNIKYNKKKKFLIFLKRENTYELLIKLISDEKNKDETIKIIYKFKYNEEDLYNSNIINFLLEYYDSTCIKENVFPESYPFLEMYSLNEINSLLNNTKHTIIAQVINAFKRVYMVLTSKGFLIPIKETGIESIGQIVTMEQLKTHNKLLNIDEYLIAMKNINKILNEKNENRFIDILGVFKVKNTSETENNSNLTKIKIFAVLTNFGQIIPIKESFVDINKFKILDFNYYDNIDEYLVNHIKDPYKSPADIYHQFILNLKNDIFKVKQILAKKLSTNEEIKKYIIYKTKTPKLSRSKKIESIISLFYKIKKKENFQFDDKFLDFIFRHIANEMLNDNVENLLLNNIVMSEVFNPNEILKRDTESVLLNIDDIKKWLKQHSE